MQQEIYHFSWNRLLRYCILPILLLLLIGFTGGCAGRRPSRPAGRSPPAAHIPQPEPQYEVYYVKKGDTLQLIGRRMGVPWERIVETNNCSPEDLKPGQVLLIPLHAGKESTGGTDPTDSRRTRDPTLSASIVIDPGHGGKDPGAVSSGGIHEKDINLAVATQVARLLKQKEFNVIMTRRGDEFIELNERAAIANRGRADLFVSIHADASLNTRARGYTLYIREGASDRSRSAAEIMESALSSNGIISRGIREANYRVLARTNVPAMLIELGFLSNKQEANMLRKHSIQNQLADSIATGIGDFSETR